MMDVNKVARRLSWHILQLLRDGHASDATTVILLQKAVPFYVAVYSYFDENITGFYYVCRCTPIVHIKQSS